MQRPDLSPGAKLTYMALLSFAWQDDHCFPGQDRLALAIGMSKRSVDRFIKELEDVRLVSHKQRGLNQTNLYTLHRFDATGIAKMATQELPILARQESPTLQGKKTQREQDSGLKKADLSRPRQTHTRHKRKEQKYDEARLTLVEFVSDLSSEFVDTASVESSTTRTVNLYHKSGLTLDDFIDRMTEARAITKERMASIKKRNSAGDKTRMAYWFAILEDRLALEQNGHPN
jgi:hypothetical protein